jgi:hypothetical protein
MRRIREYASRTCWPRYEHPSVALAQYIVASSSDGYQSLLALAEIDPDFHPGDVLVADTMDGKALDAHSGPLKLIVTEDKHPAWSVRSLVQIELKTAS